MAEKIIRWIFIIGLCGLVIGLIVIFTQKNNEQPTQPPESETIQEYKQKINELTLNLNNVTIELNQTKNELEIYLNQNTEDKETISSLKTELENLKIEKEKIQSELDKAKEDYMNSYKENYNKGYQAGYEYGLAVGRGEIDTFIQNYLSENNLMLYKSYLNEQVVDSQIIKTYLDTRKNIYDLSNIFNYDIEFENYKLLIATEQGYKTLNCINIDKSSRDFKVKVEGSGLVIVPYIVDDYSLSFSDELGNNVELKITYCENVEGNKFDAYVPGMSSGLSVTCNFVDINAELNLDNGIANLYLISSYKIN